MYKARSVLKIAQIHSLQTVSYFELPVSVSHCIDVKKSGTYNNHAYSSDDDVPEEQEIAIDCPQLKHVTRRSRHVTVAIKYGHRKGKRNSRQSKLPSKRPANILCEIQIFCSVEQQHNTLFISRPRGVPWRTTFDSQPKTATLLNDDLHVEPRTATKIDFELRQKTHLRSMLLLLFIKIRIRMN